MQNSFDISIILVVYKTLEWIEECLDSVLNQSYKNFEVIIISNDDDSAMDEKIRSIIANRDNVTYVKNEINSGGAQACNQGLELASGEYVFFMDSDDKLPKSSFKRLVKKANETNSDVVIGRGKILRNGKYYNLDYTPDWITWERELTVESIKDAPFLSFNPYYWGRLYKREMLMNNDVRLEVGAMNADRNFNCKALLAAKGISVVPEITYYWRKHDTQDDNYKSVTRSRAEKNNFLDRAAMMRKTDELFNVAGYEKVYRYSRISGLMRLLILAVDTPDNPVFRDIYVDEMNRYLNDFSDEEISGCEFLTYRIKTLAYLLKYKRYDDFDSFVKGDVKIDYTAEKSHLVYYYDIDVPPEFRMQSRFRIEEITAKMKEEKENRIFKAKADVSGINPDVAAVYLMNSHKREKMRIKPDKVKFSGSNLKVQFNIPKNKIPSLKEGADYYFALCYVTSGRVSRTKLTDKNGDVLAISREGECLVIKNGNHIFLKKEQ